MSLNQQFWRSIKYTRKHKTNIGLEKVDWLDFFQKSFLTSPCLTLCQSKGNTATRFPLNRRGFPQEFLILIYAFVTKVNKWRRFQPQIAWIIPDMTETCFDRWYYANLHQHDHDKIILLFFRKKTAYLSICLKIEYCLSTWLFVWNLYLRHSGLS